MKRFRIKIVGQSGSGLLSTGDIIMKALKHAGYWVCADREFPSLIKGGQSSYTVNFSDEPVRSLSDKVDVMIGIDKPSILHYEDRLKDGGIFIYGYERQAGLKDTIKRFKQRNIEIVHRMARQIAYQEGGNELMVNVVLVGILWKTLGLHYEYVEEEVRRRFAKKPKILAIDLRCLKAGYEAVETIHQLEKPKKKAAGSVLLDGHQALTLGAIHGGVRCYYAYPMSPSTGILNHMANLAQDTDMVVKQGEDEITVANLALGSMFMGTRALCATSGGGFDLMTETVSLAGIIESPLVIVIAQRPGPATGLPTWTAQGDLNLAIHAGHGEYARVVLGVSDPTDNFELIQHALNIAEEYQVPVMVLTERVVGETHMCVPSLKQNTIAIKRGLVTGKDLKKLDNTDRYKITKSGLSKRWIPGSAKAYYFANGDEHWEDGRLTEDGEQAKQMYAKRVRKQETIQKHLPEPVVYGPKKADISFVGWGSSKNVLLDIIQSPELLPKGMTVNYLHFSYLWPLRTEAFEAFHRVNKQVHLLEGNYEGQFGGKLEGATGLKFAGKLLKWNGRPFFLEDVLNYIQSSH